MSESSISYVGIELCILCCTGKTLSKRRKDVTRGSVHSVGSRMINTSIVHHFNTRIIVLHILVSSRMINTTIVCHFNTRIILLLILLTVNIVRYWFEKLFISNLVSKFRCIIVIRIRQIGNIRCLHIFIFLLSK